MSEADQQATAILLPPSTVAVYSQDPETLNAANAAANDWRFARVKIHVQEGDLETAISTYQQSASPDLIIIQTENMDESLAAGLENLAGHCVEGTAAIVIGPVNDVNLYRRLIDMGVSDYLVKPIQPDVMAEVIAKTLVDKLGVSGSRLIAFIGAKGGVGTSVLAQAAAWGVADVLDQKVLLLDGAGGWSTTSVGMGFEPSTTLAEAAKAAANDDEDSINRMLFKASDKLQVLASGGDVMLGSSIASGQMEELISMLLIKHPIIIADLSNSSPSIKRAMTTRANQVVVVSSPALASLRSARSLVQEVKDIRGGEQSDVELIINMQGLDAANEVPKSEIEKAMGLKISSVISFNGKLFMKSEAEGKKLVADAEGLQIVNNSLLSIIQKVLSVDPALLEMDTEKSSGFLQNVLRKIKSK
ncbi:MAG: AAA family ATPase [Alphaproteobacteria bacterium]|nr:AAA family ATPase [Alphaproteobacteria bacterium]